MSSHWIRVAQSPVSDVLTMRERFGEHRDKTIMENGAQNWSDATINQETHGATRNWEKQGRILP